MKTRINILFIITALLCGCNYSIQAPKGTVPHRVDVMKDAYGGWLTIKLLQNQNSFQGEFITVQNDTLLTLHQNQITKIPISRIASARIVVYSANSGKNYFDFPDESWNQLSQYARFPQGLPKNLHLADLKSRSVDQNGND